MAQLIRASLIATDWKTEYGFVLQLGVTDHVDKLNMICDWVAIQKGRDTIVVDALKGMKSKIVPGVSAPLASPPTLHSRARLHREMPTLKAPLLFVHVANGDIDALAVNFERIRPPTVIMGTVKNCARLLVAANLTAQPLYFHRDYVSMRIES